MSRQTEKGFVVLDWQELDVNTDAGSIATVNLLTPVLATSAVGGLTFKGQLATMVCTAAHGLFNGQVVNILSATDAGYNGYYRITVIDTLTFTYVPTTAPAVTPDVGAANVYTLKVRKAYLISASTNTGTITVGVKNTGTGIPILPGQFVEVSEPTVQDASGFPACFDLGKWFIKGSVLNQSLTIMYLPL